MLYNANGNFTYVNSKGTSCFSETLTKLCVVEIDSKPVATEEDVMMDKSKDTSAQVCIYCLV